MHRMVVHTTAVQSSDCCSGDTERKLGATDLHPAEVHSPFWLLSLQIRLVPADPTVSWRGQFGRLSNFANFPFQEDDVTHCSLVNAVSCFVHFSIYVSFLQSSHRYDQGVVTHTTVPGVLGSNLGPNFSYSDFGFSWFLSVPPSKCRDHFLVNRVQFVIN
jgi:hypothetical protein